MEKLKVASLFCGCGGTDVGMMGGFDFLVKHYAENGVKIVYANDFERWIPLPIIFNSSTES